jgi:hypothetical protein
MIIASIKIIINVKSQHILDISKPLLREVYTEVGGVALRLSLRISNVLGSSLGQYTALLIEHFGSYKSLQESPL